MGPRSTTRKCFSAATMILVVSHISGHRQLWCIHNKHMTGGKLLEALLEREGQASDVVLQSEGRILSPTSQVFEDATVVATLRLPGGKGGFGSMLRAIGAQIEKTTNREACRDLSGRRLRDINEEKRLKDFISKKAEREHEIQERKRQKFEKLKETPKHTFQNDLYYQQRKQREKNLYDSLDKAFENVNGSGPSGIKRQGSNIKEETVSKTKRGRFMDDLDVSSEDDSEIDDESPCATKSSRMSENESATEKEDNVVVSADNLSCKETSDEDSDHAEETSKNVHHVNDVI
ncbi:splicing regulator SDE2 isoform X1 [Procambarus clarkii]|uniref:splicing regulator SDE2 isoform X1 n=2 Tax=Procambarus clarkii TaxID=6728 RepID=UPI003743C242